MLCAAELLMRLLWGFVVVRYTDPQSHSGFGWRILRTTTSTTLSTLCCTRNRYKDRRLHVRLVMIRVDKVYIVLFSDLHGLAVLYNSLTF